MHQAVPSSEPVEAMYAVPYLAQLLVRQSAGVLSCCSQHLKCLVHTCAICIHLPMSDIGQLVKGDWPNLAVVAPWRHILDSFEWPRSTSLELLAMTDLSQDDLLYPHDLGITACIVRSKQHDGRSRLSVDSTHFGVAMTVLQELGWQHASRLALRSDKLGLSHIAQLVATGEYRLKQVAIHDNSLDAVAVANVMKDCCPLLERLELTLSNLGTDAIKVLIECRWPLLKVLSLTCTNLDHEQPLCLTSTYDSLPTLSCLYLSGISLDSSSTFQLICGQWLRLQTLCLLSAGLQKDILSALTPWHWLCLLELDISNNSLGPDDIAVLHKARFYRKLKRLDLHSNRVDAAAMKHLVTFSLTRLQTLRLDNNYLDNSAMRHLAQGDWPILTHLHLEDNFIDAAGVSMLTKGNWVSLQHMSLDTTAVRVYPGWVICKLGSPSRINRLWLGRMSFEGQFSTGVTRHQTVWFTRANSVSLCTHLHTAPLSFVFDPIRTLLV